jgi:GT2 family glycosyltransferase
VHCQIGGFVEDVALKYAPDDIDFYVRAVRQGFQAYFLRDLEAWHQTHLDRTVYRTLSSGNPRRASTELALRLADQYDRQERSLVIAPAAVPRYS